MHLTVITNTAGWGGTEEMVHRVLRRLRLRGSAATIVQVGHRQYSDRGFVSDGISTLDFPGTLGSVGLWQWFRVLGRLRTHTIVLFKGSVQNRAWQLDVACRLLGVRYVTVEAHFPDANVALKTPKTAIAVARGIVRRLRHRIRYGFHSRIPDRIIAFSDSSLQELQKRYHYPSNLALVYLGVDSATFAPSESLRRLQRAEWGIHEQDLVVGAVGRLDPVKRMDWGVRAFAAFCKANPTKSCWLVLGGEGQSRHSLERLARELNIADRVKFLGWVSSSHAFNTALDIYVLPSRAEGFGIALIESMATECACVATDSGGPREIITEPKIGWLVPREDELAFASALSEAMSMSLEQLRTIGRAARCSVQQRFDEATLSEALLLEILGTPSSP